ncbi:MAG: hypothetical protein L0Y71_18745 [Gemmataceae bacterium]|nr:hypothetical protein [Gemmataceae bacterium]
MASQGSRQRRRTTLAAAAAALALISLGLVAVRGQDVVRQDLTTPDNAQQIRLMADHIATWTEGGRRVFFLHGQAWIEQGLVNLRMPQGVVWVDEDAKEKSGVYRVEVYGEDTVTIDNGPGRQVAQTAIVQLATRGDLRITASEGEVRQITLTKEPLYQRALQVKAARPAAAAPAPKPLAKDLTATPLAPIPPPLPPVPSASAIQQVQALQPPPPPPPNVAPIPPAPTPTPIAPSPVAPSPVAPSVAAPAPLPPRPEPSGPPRRFSIKPRTSLGISAKVDNLGGETAIIVPTGVIITVGDPGDPKGFLDIEADRMVLWTKGNPQEIFSNMQSTQGGTSDNLEFYLTGNVEIRTLSKAKAGGVTEILRADEVYYDVSRNVAIALRGDLEIRDPKIPNPIHFQAEEFFRLNERLYQTNQMQVFSTILPSDPGLKIEVRQATIEERDTARRNIFGLTFTDLETGEPVRNKEHYLKGRDMVVRVEGVPVFYFPYLGTTIEDPLGPLESVNFGANRIFGFHVLTTWDIFDLIGVERPDHLRWELMIDYLTERGPALGTEFRGSGKSLFGIPARHESRILAWGLYDQGDDILGGDRGRNIFIDPTTRVPVTHPEWRGRFLGKWNIQELPLGFSVQAQASLISDRNFLEQFYQHEFYNDLNQETSLYVKQQIDRWAWSVLAEPRVRSWVTETEWLPRGDGYLIGEKFFNLFTYNFHASAGYAQLRPAEGPAFPFSPTDAPTNTGRFDIWQDLSLPFQAGPFKVVPYTVLDLAYFTEDLTGDDQGRAYGGAGLRSSIPFSKLYPNVDSELFNLCGLYHKIVLSGNYFIADSNTRFTTLPQLDRLNDDATDQALRDIRPLQPHVNPANAAFLTSSALFDPQFYALRRLVDNRLETLDQMNVVQLDLRQRWQTKRGMPGNQHVVDWMTLGVGLSVFPQSNRDNFGETLGIIEYDWIWNIGDRTALVSDGWFETIDGGPRVYNGGIVISRPDNTSFYLGYRQIDPLESKAVVASVTYAFSAKYAGTASTLWDFGTDNQHYSLMLTRIGTDLRMSIGLSYNSILNNFGVQFEIVPNLIRGNRNPGFAPGALGGGLARR